MLLVFYIHQEGTNLPSNINTSLKGKSEAKCASSIYNSQLYLFQLVKEYSNLCYTRLCQGKGCLWSLKETWYRTHDPCKAKWHTKQTHCHQYKGHKVNHQGCLWTMSSHKGTILFPWQKPSPTRDAGILPVTFISWREQHLSRAAVWWTTAHGS